jgi:hypothetical protein
VLPVVRPEDRVALDRVTVIGHDPIDPMAPTRHPAIAPAARADQADSVAAPAARPKRQIRCIVGS